MTNEHVYRLGGNNFYDVPILVAYQDKPILTVPTKSRSEGLQCYVYRDGRHIATVRGDRAFQSPGCDEDAVVFERYQDSQRLIHAPTGTVILQLDRQGLRPDTTNVTLLIELPNRIVIKASPNRFESGNVAYENCTFRSMPCAVAVDCQQTKAVIGLTSPDLAND